MARPPWRRCADALRRIERVGDKGPCPRRLGKPIAASSKGNFRALFDSIGQIGSAKASHTPDVGNGLPRPHI
jgi:hypothetical protein